MEWQPSRCIHHDPGASYIAFAGTNPVRLLAGSYLGAPPSFMLATRHSSNPPYLDWLKPCSRAINAPPSYDKQPFFGKRRPARPPRYGSKRRTFNLQSQTDPRPPTKEKRAHWPEKQPCSSKLACLLSRVFVGLIRNARS